MDFGTLNGIYIIFLIFIFIGLFIWAFSKKRKGSFDEAANLVFADEKKVKQEADNTEQGTKK